MRLAQKCALSAHPTSRIARQTSAVSQLHTWNLHGGLFNKCPYNYREAVLFQGSVITLMHIIHLHGKRALQFYPSPFNS